MTKILVSDEHPETKNLLIKCLETAGFKVIGTENGLVDVQLVDNFSSTNTESKQSNAPQSIFPSIPRLYKVVDFIKLNVIIQSHPHFLAKPSCHPESVTERSLITPPFLPFFQSSYLLRSISSFQTVP